MGGEWERNGSGWQYEGNEIDIRQHLFVFVKDDIKIEDLKDVRKIEIRGAGLNDYSVLSLHYDDNSIKSTNLYLNEKSYYIDQYLSKHHKFNYNDMAKISIFISFTTIVFTIYAGRKKLVDNKKQ